MPKLIVPLEPLRPQSVAAAPPAAPRGFALWQLGFRPFYLLASVFAALSVGLWTAQYRGWLDGIYAANPVAHGQEMLFGFALAVVTGFLFTAVRNWTAQPTPTGGLLAAYALLWLAGRVLAFMPWHTAAMAANIAFVLAVAAGIAVPMVRSANRRNYFFIALLVLFGPIPLAMHLADVDVLAWPQRLSLRTGLDLLLFIMAVMGGRVIPMFTNNGVPGTQAVRRPLLEKAALGSIIALLAADVLRLPPAGIAAVAAAAALLNAGRLFLWQPWRTLRTPLVWILHAAYGWIVIYLVLRALAALDLVAEPLAVHALAIGAIGGMTIGMMTRTARGHTGRPLVVDRFEIACFALVQAAAIARVFGGMLFAQWYADTVAVAGACWALAFALYAVRYWPILSRPRVDGKPG